MASCVESLHGDRFHMKELWVMWKSNPSKARSLQCEGDRVPSSFCEVACAGPRGGDAEDEMGEFSRNGEI